MRPRTAPPFRADHVGSLLRPRRLLDARDAHSRGLLTAAALREVEDAVTVDDEIAKLRLVAEVAREVWG